MSAITDQVLPNRSGPLQKAQTDVDVEFILPDDFPIEDLWNPWTCPEPFLDLLAAALSVDWWRDAWPFDVKRRVIAASPAIHKIKGKRAAIRMALLQLGITCEIRAWWQMDPPGRRGTFEVTALLDKPLYPGLPIWNEQVVTDAFQTIKATKPKSRVFNLKVAALQNGPAYVGAYAQAGGTFTALPLAQDAPPIDGPVYAAAHNHSGGTYTVEARTQ